MAVHLTILGSGSSGNCAYLETPEARILIDAGFSGRQIRERLATIGRSPESLTGILVTHEHSDHITGLISLADRLQIPIYCNRPTQDAILWDLKEHSSKKRTPLLNGLESDNARTKTKLDWRLFQTGSSFEINDLLVETFSIPHDAAEPVGFLLKTSAGNIGFATDLGHVTKLVLERIRHANVLILESNHDVKMLQDCPRRPWSLKQRILGRHGHLSNDAAADCAEQIMSAELLHLFLGHLSRECNRPALAQETMSQRLQKIGATHVALQMTSQTIPCPVLNL